MNKRANILVSVDIEGVAGVFHTEQTRAGNGEYERARRWMTEEANAVIRGALAAGATAIKVNDSHGGFRNLLPDLLHPEARMVLGKPRVLGMTGGVDHDIDAVMLVGYHSRAQGRGILAHTTNSFAFARVWLGGQELGEAGLYGALAAEHGVPVIFGSGDDAFIEENQPLFPHAIFAETKKAYGANSGDSLTPQQSCVLLEERARQAVTALVANPAAMPVLPLRGPLRCRLQAQTVALTDLFSQLPILERTDNVTVEFDAPTAEYAVRVLNSLSAMSAMLR
ncbi:MAG: M55 family metallopeptidase [Herbaspirillum sp.]|uniref:M55 family metallopeptidase n=1 Tax=Herbaspirillum sp. TaxID=1890675 RepID=UPI002587FE23|nr:M55 family metallopeptidase [Herbaspirillum sp.]MCP3657242.1 M55 family metallopeptidase [Herbaspirillum sp.]MCP3945963.1 M55 family metallopeptidase [Herbaspirillum sp.]MCP4032279.1 M55 family metallopeptidase [Herbaspirillum sp.]MCP4558290.1 M55 family metallopeptidase [Herbaspirillum sp.]